MFIVSVLDEGIAIAVCSFLVSVSTGWGKHVIHGAMLHSLEYYYERKSITLLHYPADVHDLHNAWQTIDKGSPQCK